MRNLFAIVGLSVTALTTACGASSHPTTNADRDSGGMSDSAAKGDGVAGAKNDTAYGPDSVGDVKASGVDAGTAADVSSTGGRIVVGTGGSGVRLAATRSLQPAVRREATAPRPRAERVPLVGPSPQAAPAELASREQTSAAGTTSSAGITSAAGTSGSAGKTTHRRLLGQRWLVWHCRQDR